MNAPAFQALRHGELLAVADEQRRVLLLADARALLALARMAAGRIKDESRCLRHPGYPERIVGAPYGHSGYRLTRSDSHHFIERDGPVIEDARITLSDSISVGAFVAALMAHVPAGLACAARPADDLWSAR